MKLATLCYLRKDGKTLMIHRNKRPNDMNMGKWNGLGGKLEPGETPEECAFPRASRGIGPGGEEPGLPRLAHLSRLCS